VVIPVHDVNPVRRTPWVTYALIALNVIVLALLTPGGLPGTGPQAAVVCRQDAFYQHYGAIPRELTAGHPLRIVFTGREVSTPSGPACLAGRPRYRKIPALSVLSAMFIHAGWLHLLGNMLFLAIFGNNVEDRFGRLPYLLLYLASGYVAAYGFAAVHPHSAQPLVGASGAISGVLGAYLVLYPRARVWSLVPSLFFLPLRIPAWFVLGLWFVIQWLYAAGQVAGGGPVAYVAHVFGFVFGMLAGLLLRAASRGGAVPRHRNR
jgi:membrane associated rhomboid family serine protease